jgi:hypothetical protein
MNWKGFGRKLLSSNLGYYPGTCLQGLRKTTDNLSQDSRFPGRDLNLEPPEYEAGVLTTRPRRSVYLGIELRYVRKLKQFIALNLLIL